MMTVVVMDGQANHGRPTRDAQAPRVHEEVALINFRPTRKMLTDADTGSINHNRKERDIYINININRQVGNN